MARVRVTEAQAQYFAEHLKMPLEQGFKNLHVAVTTGIGLGSAFPGLAERLWEVGYERSVDSDARARWRRAGLDVGHEPPDPVTLAKRQEQLLLLVQSFASRERPELLNHFSVRG